MQDVCYSQAIPPIEAYYPLFVATGWNENLRLSKMQLSEALRGSWFSVCAYAGTALVGTGRLVCDGAYECFVCDVIVHPDSRGQGIGKEIVSRLLEHARAQGIPWVQVTVARGKSGFYEELGFEPRPADAPGMDIWF